MADSLRARTPINLSAVLYEQAAARTGLPAEVSNIDLDFVPGVAFIPDVHMADSLRARTLINPSAVLYEQAAARTGLPAEVGNISSTSLRARTLINLSAVGIIDLDFVPGVAFDAMGNVELTGDLLGDADCVNNNNNNVAPTPQFSPTALLNPRSLALKRPASSSSDLDCGPSLAKRIKTDEDCKKSTHRQGFNGSSSLELQKTSSQAPSQTGPSIDLTISDDDDVQLVRDNIEELICVGKVKHTYVQAYTVPYPDLKKYLSNSGQQGRIKVSFRRARNNRNNLNIIVTDPTSREFGRLYCKRKWAYNISKFHKGKNIQLLRPVFELQRYDYYNLQDSSIYVLRSVDEIWADVADVFDTVVSKSDEVPTREPSSYIKTELYLHQKQALYFMWDKEQDYSAEEHDQRKDTLWALRLRDNSQRASLILFMT
ncbi:hypothetical protein HBH53_101800 [Parastagonospora nodorum]|nr:hypothetical protein HBH53_101800 [Parastagonospora nodorum]